MDEQHTEEVKEAIIRALKMEKEARKAYLSPPECTSKFGTFNFKYRPRDIKAPTNNLPTDNNIISDYQTSGRTIHISRTAFNMQSKDSSNTIGEILVDGGCDTSLVGKGFVVESTSSRSVSVQGFNDSMKLDKLLIVTALTAVVNNHLLQLVLGGPRKCFHTYQLLTQLSPAHLFFSFSLFSNIFFNFQTIFIFFTLESSSFVISYFFIFFFKFSAS